MIEMIDQGKKIVEPVIVYVSAGMHYLLQYMNPVTEIARYEGAVNVLVGVLVAIYTATKIIDWFWKQQKRRRANEK